LLVHIRDVHTASACTFFSYFKRLHRPAKLATSYNAYIEFVPFRKLLADAQLRNSIFFKKLTGREQ